MDLEIWGCSAFELGFWLGLGCLGPGWCGLVHRLSLGPGPGAFVALLELGASLVGR